jgi:hypothetical protein
MLRIHIINWLTSSLLLDDLLAHGLQQNPPLALTAIDGLGGPSGIPNPGIPQAEVLSRARVLVFYHLAPGPWLSILLAIGTSSILIFIQQLDALYFRSTRKDMLEKQQAWQSSVRGVAVRGPLKQGRDIEALAVPCSHRVFRGGTVRSDIGNSKKGSTNDPKCGVVSAGVVPAAFDEARARLILAGLHVKHEPPALTAPRRPLIRGVGRVPSVFVVVIFLFGGEEHSALCCDPYSRDDARTGNYNSTQGT